MTHALHNGVLCGHLKEQRPAYAQQGQLNLLLQSRPPRKECHQRQLRLLDASSLKQTQRRGSTMWCAAAKGTVTAAKTAKTLATICRPLW